MHTPRSILGFHPCFISLPLTFSGCNNEQKIQNLIKRKEKGSNIIHIVMLQDLLYAERSDTWRSE
jgi:hypothetical protein